MGSRVSDRYMVSDESKLSNKSRVSDVSRGVISLKGEMRAVE